MPGVHVTDHDIKKKEGKKTVSDKPWGISDIPDQNGRVVIVTGASSGIGLETAQALAARNAHVVLASRNSEKNNRAVASILRNHPQATIEARSLDLADLKSTGSFAEGIKSDFDRLDLLINNAGVMMCPYEQTSDGFEIQFGTNHLGHFALTGFLLPLLSQTQGARIVVVSSLAHRAGALDFSDLNWQARKYKTMQAYCDSKLANLYFTHGLVDRLEEAGDQTLVTAAHPGWTRTDLQRHAWKFRFIGRFMGQDAATGALPTLRAAVDGSARPGDFFGPAGRGEMRGPPIKVDPAKIAGDEEAARQLWKLSEEMTGVCY